MNNVYIILLLPCNNMTDFVGFGTSVIHDPYEYLRGY